MEAALPIPHIWVPKYLRRNDTQKASGLVNAGKVGGRNSLVNPSIIRRAGSPLDLTGIVAYYKQEQSAGADSPDSSGAGLTLTANGSTGSVAGKIGNACDYTGGSTYHSRTDDANFSMGTGVEWTIHFWLNPDNVGLSPAPVCVAKGTSIASNATYEYAVLLNANVMQMLVSDGTNNDNIGHSTELSTGNWYFIAARLWDNAGTRNCDLNVNNGTPAADTSSRWTWDSTGPFLVGGGIVSRYLDGKIDELGIWKRKLSDAELTILYAGGAGLQLFA